MSKFLSYRFTPILYFLYWCLFSQVREQKLMLLTHFLVPAVQTKGCTLSQAVSSHPFLLYVCNWAERRKDESGLRTSTLLPSSHRTCSSLADEDSQQARWGEKTDFHNCKNVAFVEQREGRWRRIYFLAMKKFHCYVNYRTRRKRCNILCNTDYRLSLNWSLFNCNKSFRNLWSYIFKIPVLENTLLLHVMPYSWLHWKVQSCF